MWKIRSENRKSPKNTLKSEIWTADDNYPEAFSVFSFNASTVSSFELTFADPLVKLNEWLVRCEIRNSVGKL